MLVIRQEQMKPLRAYMREQFELRMVDHMRQFYSESKVDHKALWELIQLCIAKAESFNIVYEDDIRRFIEFWAKYELQKEDKLGMQLFGDILQISNIDGAEKMHLIDHADIALLRKSL